MLALVPLQCWRASIFPSFLAWYPNGTCVDRGSGWWQYKVDRTGMVRITQRSMHLIRLCNASTHVQSIQNLSVAASDTGALCCTWCRVPCITSLLLMCLQRFYSWSHQIISPNFSLSLHNFSQWYCGVLTRCSLYGDNFAVREVVCIHHLRTSFCSWRGG